MRRSGYRRRRMRHTRGNCRHMLRPPGSEESWVRCAWVQVGLCVRQPGAVLQCGVLRYRVFVLGCNALYCVSPCVVLCRPAFQGIECCIATLYFSCFAATKAAHEHEERAVA